MQPQYSTLEFTQPQAPVTNSRRSLVLASLSVAFFGLACVFGVAAFRAHDQEQSVQMLATTAVTGLVPKVAINRPRISVRPAGPIPLRGLGQPPTMVDTGILALRVRTYAGQNAAATNYAPPDMDKRKFMNALLLGAVSLPVGSLAVPFAAYFVPPKSGGAGGAQAALDSQGNPVSLESWLSKHGPNDRSLVQGLKGDATYLIVTKDQSGIKDFGLSAVCTHLGCVVPWNAAENKFMCPCHGSQYDENGKKIRGPAPLSLALAHVNTDGGKVAFSEWKETDFRDGSNPWWA